MHGGGGGWGGGSVTCLSAPSAQGPGVGYYMASNCERSEERRMRKEVERGEEEKTFRCDLTWVSTQETVSVLFGLFTYSLVEFSL